MTHVGEHRIAAPGIKPLKQTLIVSTIVYLITFQELAAGIPHSMLLQPN